MTRIEVIPIPGIPEVKAGDDLGKIIVEALRKARIPLRDRDVVVVKQKVVSKSEGRW